jgi:hypothetical protein
LEKNLGTFWEYYDIWPAHTGEEEVVPDHIRIPLALVMKPELLKSLKNSPIAPPGGKLSIPGSGITEGADLSKDEFLSLMSGAMNASGELQKTREEELRARREAEEQDRRRGKPSPGKVPRAACPSCIRSPKGVCPLHENEE